MMKTWDILILSTFFVFIKGSDVSIKDDPQDDPEFSLDNIVTKVIKDSTFQGHGRAPSTYIIVGNPPDLRHRKPAVLFKNVEDFLRSKPIKASNVSHGPTVVYGEFTEKDIRSLKEFLRFQFRSLAIVTTVIQTNWQQRLDEFGGKGDYLYKVPIIHVDMSRKDVASIHSLCIACDKIILVNAWSYPQKKWLKKQDSLCNCSPMQGITIKVSSPTNVFELLIPGFPIFHTGILNILSERWKFKILTLKNNLEGVAVNKLVCQRQLALELMTLNGTWTGIVGDIVFGRADMSGISFGQRFDRNQAIDYTTSVTFREWVFSTRKPKSATSFWWAFLPLEDRSWIAFTITFAILFVSVLIFDQINGGKKFQFDGQYLSKELESMLTFEKSINTLRLSKLILIIMALCAGTFLSWFYQSMVIAFQVKQFPEKSIDYMKDILDRKIPIYMFSTIPMEESNHLDPVRREVLDRAIFRLTNVANVVGTIQEVMRDDEVGEYFGALFQPKYEHPPWPAYNSREVVDSYPTAFMIARGSIIKPYIDWTVTQLKDGGIVDKLWKDFSLVQESAVRKSFPAHYSESDKVKPMQMKAMLLPLMICGIGLALSTVLFVGELAVNRWLAGTEKPSRQNAW